MFGTRKDYLQPCRTPYEHDVKKYFVCVQKERPRDAYLVDMTDILSVKTELIEKPPKVDATFSLLSQILPSKQPFLGDKHFNVSDLNNGSIEFKIIASLFYNTLSIFPREIKGI